MNPLSPACLWIAAALIAVCVSAAPVIDATTAQQDAEATEASLNDALAQAQRERPDLWGAAEKARAKRAAAVAARHGVQP